MERKEKRGLGDEMHLYGGGGCKAKKEAKKTWLEVKWLRII